MTIRARILLGLWPVLCLVPLSTAVFQYRVHARELRWAQDEEVKTFARALAEMARADESTIGSFAPGPTVAVPARVRTVIERDGLLRVAAVRLADRTRAFDSDPTRPLPEPPGGRLEDLAADDSVRSAESATSFTAWAPVHGREGQPVGMMLAETRSDAPAQSAAARRRALVVAGVPSLVSLGVCLWLGWFLTRHVRRLRVVADVGVEEGSSLTMHLGRLKVSSLPEPSPIQEIQDLGTALDTMTSVVAESFQKTRRTLVAADPSADERRLPAVFAATLAEDRSALVGGVRAETRRIGVAAGDASFLKAGSERLRAAALRVAEGSGLHAQVAAESAVELLRGAAGDSFAVALNRLSTSYRLEMAVAAEAAADGITIWSYRTSEGWSARPGRASGLELLHTLGEQTARSVELYVAAYDATPVAALADELVGLATGWDEGVLVVLRGPQTGDGARPVEASEGRAR